MTNCDPVTHCMNLTDDDEAWVEPAGNCGGPEVCSECRSRLVRFTNLVEYHVTKAGKRMPRTPEEWQKALKRKPRKS